jgi:4-alpha-glucanotransferase
VSQVTTPGESPRDDKPATAGSQLSADLAELAGLQLPADLAELARANGVDLVYYPVPDRPVKVPEATVRSLLAALGMPANNATQIAQAQAKTAADQAAWPTVIVIRQGAATVLTGLPPSAVTAKAYPQATAQLHFNTDEQTAATPAKHRLSLRLQWLADERLAVTLPADLPLGWHQLLIYGQPTDSTPCLTSTVVITPARIDWPKRLTETNGATHRPWGVMAQLYAVRSRQSWGLGDLVDLAELAELLAPWGADFLLINPLHAPAPGLPVVESPYLPASRAFLNPLYIRPEAISEYAAAPEVLQQAISDLAQQAAAANDSADLLDYNRAWLLKRQALEKLFELGLPAQRAADFAAFRQAKGSDLTNFALWCLLVDTWPGHPTDLPKPEDLRPDSPAAAALLNQHRHRLDFYAWLQWVTAQQLTAAGQRAKAAGMSLGIIGDLAVSSHPDGADSWIYGDLLAKQAELGAPPNGLTTRGQGWGAHPWNPQELERQSYRPLRQLLRTALENTGGVRIDHALGLFRLWWIPQGNQPEDGSFVACDVDAQLGILALEAKRHGNLVIGEDLGLIEPGYREKLADWGLIGNTVLWFASEDDAVDDGGFFGSAELRPGGHLAPERYRYATMAVLTTHDLPPSLGIVSGSNIDERLAHGVLDGDLETAVATAAAGRQRMAEFLVEQRFLQAAEQTDDAAMVDALHRYLMAVNSVLVGVNLPDLVGQTESQNLPGTSYQYPNWRLPLRNTAGQAVLLEDLTAQPTFQRLISVIQQSAALGV